MREMWQIVDVTRDNHIHVIETYGTEKEALEHMTVPADLMGDVVWTIRRVWTNRMERS